MVRKSQLVLFSAVSLSVLAMGNGANAEGIAPQEYKGMHAPDGKCGIVCQRKKAIEEAEKKHKEEATKPAWTRRRGPAVSQAADPEIKQIEKDIVEARKLVQELEKSGGSAALDKIKADLEKDKIPPSQAESILSALGDKAEEEKLPEINLSHPLKIETTEEEHIVTTLPPPPGMPGRKPGVAPSPTPDGLKAPPADKPPLSGHDALLEAIRKRRID